MSEITPPAGDQDAPVALDQVCALSVGAVEYVGAPCSSCGHTSLAHPGPTNPALVECVLCRVAVTLDDLVAWCGGLETSLEVVVGAAQALEARVAALEAAR